MTESIYTRDDLDNAIKKVCPTFTKPEVWKCLNRPTALRIAIVDAFIDWHIWEHEHETVVVLRAAESDLREHGQFNFLDSE